MDPMEEIKQMFFVECEELLETLQEGLEVLGEGQDDGERVGTIFRAVHSIKGGAAAFSLDELVRFAHTFETTLDEIRSNRLTASPEVLGTLVRAADVLNDLVAAARDGGEVDPERIDAQIEALAVFVGGPAASGTASAPQAPEAPDTAPDEENGDAAATGPADPVAPAEAAVTPRYRIGFRPHATLFERGNEPALILRDLAEAGEIRVTCDLAALPTLEEIDPMESYLSWDIEIATPIDEGELREIFDFVEGDCDLAIERLRADSDPAGAADLPATEPSRSDAPAVKAPARKAPAAKGSAPAAPPKPRLARPPPAAPVAVPVAARRCGSISTASTG